MKNQRDKLRQYKKRIALVTDREHQIAKECLAKGQKDKALLALRRKKYQESLLEQTDGQLEQLEKLTSSVEFALVQKDVLYSLQRGTEVLKIINAEMGGIEAVEKIVGDTEEARRQAQEISDALAGQLSNQDEDEVEDELEALEKEINGISVPSAPQTDPLPDVPFHEPATADEMALRRKERERQRRIALEAS